MATVKSPLGDNIPAEILYWNKDTFLISVLLPHMKDVNTISLHKRGRNNHRCISLQSFKARAFVRIFFFFLKSCWYSLTQCLRKINAGSDQATLLSIWNFSPRQLEENAENKFSLCTLPSSIPQHFWHFLQIRPLRSLSKDMLSTNS